MAGENTLQMKTTNVPKELADPNLLAHCAAEHWFQRKPEVTQKPSETNRLNSIGSADGFVPTNHLAGGTTQQRETKHDPKDLADSSLLAHCAAKH